ncbi:MAG TPA: preprotein translocase subunit SecG, partial [Solirubrobacteraceae bacterium]|nr:preprotein translocase subunit SecG [Solirubrobacteraceae bacterium]
SSRRSTTRRAEPVAARLSYPAGMENILSGVQVLLSIAVIFLVLMHSGKDAGLSGAFGVGTGAGPFGGGSLVERNLNRWTVAFAILFVLNTIVLLRL